LTRDADLARLAALQGRLRAHVAGAVEALFHLQVHPELSPLGWHLEHCLYVECFWIREALLGDARVTRDLRDRAWPMMSRKAERGGKLPSRAALVATAEAFQTENLRLLEGLLGGGGRLLANDYLLRFLIGHHAQHDETMATARLHHRFGNGEAHRVRQPLRSLRDDVAWRSVPPGTHRIGGGDGRFAFDNELSRHDLARNGFAIAAFPVSNGAFLAFMDDDGYRRRDLWSDDGWTWRARQSVSAPAFWMRDAAGAWYAIGPEGAADLDPAAPVTGISRYEAEAFARWAGARLPHEVEWEAAARAGLVDGTGTVWEWCANAFYAYPGFTPFPYEAYSLPWFDGRHFTLKGGSRLTAPEIARPGFRNFYTAGTRHVLNGFRLAW